MIRLIKTTTFDANRLNEEVWSIINRWVTFSGHLGYYPKDTKKFQGNGIIKHSILFDFFSFGITPSSTCKKYFVDFVYNPDQLPESDYEKLSSFIEKDTYTLEELLKKTDNLLANEDPSALDYVFFGWGDSKVEESITQRIKLALSISNAQSRAAYASTVCTSSNLTYFQLLKNEIKQIYHQEIDEELKDWLEAVIEHAEYELELNQYFEKQQEIREKEFDEIYTLQEKADMRFYNWEQALQELVKKGYQVTPLDDHHFKITLMPTDSIGILSIYPNKLQCLFQINTSLRFNQENTIDFLHLINHIHQVYPYGTVLLDDSTYQIGIRMGIYYYNFEPSANLLSNLIQKNMELSNILIPYFEKALDNSYNIDQISVQITNEWI